MFDFGRVSGWLGLTGQEFRILKVIYRLEDSGDASPGQVVKLFERLYGGRLYKSNLFATLRDMQALGIISKRGRGSYCVDFGGIQKFLEVKKTGLERELDDFSRVCEDTEEYFRRYIERPSTPRVEYLDYESLYARLTGSVNSCRVYNEVCSFPLLCYTPYLADSLGRGSLYQSLWKKCVTGKKIQVNYLTDLNVDYLFNQCFRTHGDPKTAYKEASSILNQVETLAHRCDNLQIRVLDEAYGMDSAIPEHEKPVEFYLFTRDEHQDIMGATYIRSHDSARDARKMFIHSFEYAEDITGNRGEAILKEMHKTLEEKYSVLDALG